MNNDIEIPKPHCTLIINDKLEELYTADQMKAMIEAERNAKPLPEFSPIQKRSEPPAIIMAKNFKIALRDDGYRIYARFLDPIPNNDDGSEIVWTEYKHCDYPTIGFGVARFLMQCAQLFAQQIEGE